MVVIRDTAQHDDLLLAFSLGFLGQFLGQRMNELILAESRRKGFKHMRTSHGYLIQHLVATDHPVSRTGSELARRMGISQQAASKMVAELVRLGAVEVAASTDRRAKQVSLSASGWAAVQQARLYRAKLERRLRQNLGEKQYAEAHKTLRKGLALLGGLGRIRSRQIREPD